jgi:hypothetical protein
MLVPGAPPLTVSEMRDLDVPVRLASILANKPRRTQAWTIRWLSGYGRPCRGTVIQVGQRGDVLSVRHE